MSFAGSSLREPALRPVAVTYAEAAAAETIGSVLHTCRLLLLDAAMGHGTKTMAGSVRGGLPLHAAR